MEKLHSEVSGCVSIHHEGKIDHPKLVIQLLHSGRQGTGGSKDSLGSCNYETWKKAQILFADPYHYAMLSHQDWYHRCLVTFGRELESP